MANTATANSRNWRDLIKPTALEVEKDSLTDTYGKFVAKPLERGFGQTLGNSLRRLLLSSIQGAAVTAIKIDGVLHEFSSIPGVAEDVTDIILNLKELNIASHTEDERRATLKLQGPKQVTGADIETDGTFEILNPDHHIATLGEGATLNMELVIKSGRGYVAA